MNSTQTQPILKNMDHLFHISEDADKAFAFFKDILQLRTAWPLDQYKGGGKVFRGGAFWTGNFNLEIAGGQVFPGANGCAIAFDTVGDNEEALKKIEELGVLKSKLPKSPFTLDEVNQDCQSEWWKLVRDFVKDGDKPVWTLKGIADLGPVEENEIIPREAPFLFNCRYHVDMESVDRENEKKFIESEGGPMGILRVSEIIIEADEKNYEFASKNLKATLEIGSTDKKQPKFSVVKGENNQLKQLNWAVRNLQRAKDHLQANKVEFIENERGFTFRLPYSKQNITLQFVKQMEI